MGFQPGNKYGQGRPKGSTYNEICKQFAEKEGVARLVEWAKGTFRNAHGQVQAAGWSQPKDTNGKPKGRLVWAGPDYSLQFEALKLVLAYGLGKPRNPVDITSGGQTLTDWANEWFGYAAANGNGNGHHNGNGDGGDRPEFRSFPGEDSK